MTNVAKADLDLLLFQLEQAVETLESILENE